MLLGLCQTGRTFPPQRALPFRCLFQGRTLESGHGSGAGSVTLSLGMGSSRGAAGLWHRAGDGAMLRGPCVELCLCHEHP